MKFFDKDTKRNLSQEHNYTTKALKDNQVKTSKDTGASRPVSHEALLSKPRGLFKKSTPL